MSPAPPLVGVIGGYGAVGAVAARCLAAEGGVRLRVGGRDAAAAARCASRLAVPAEPAVVDATDGDGLARFSRGCAVVLNCAGPAYELSGLPRHAAATAGADYVDVMDGSAPGPGPAGERTAVLSAGMSPGLSGLLPRLLVGGAVRPVRFTGYYVGLGTFTHTGAVDYLLSMRRGYGTPLAQWRGGRVERGALSPVEACRLPALPHPVTAYPYLTEELVHQARVLGLAEARWYNAFDGHHLLDALSRHQAAGARAGDVDAEAAAVVRASALDALGRTPYHLLWGVLDGRDRAGAPVRRTALVRGEDGSALTGVVGAVAAREVLLGRVPAGAHLAADVLPAGAVAAALRAHLPGTVVSVTDVPPPADHAVPAPAGPPGGAVDAAVVEEGVL